MRSARALLLLLCLAGWALAASSAATAQTPLSRAPRSVPLSLSVRMPIGKPPLSARGLTLQTGAGVLGGLAGGLVATLPLAMASWNSPMGDGILTGVLGAAYLAGTTAGVHYAGRAQGMRANPWISAAGVLGGLVVSGAAMQPFIDEEGNVTGPAPLLVFILPGVGGTAAYAATRAAR